MAVVVKPENFEQVEFEASEISRIALSTGEAVCPQAVAGTDVVIEIDENAPTGRAHVALLNPVTFHVESGALERYSRPRTMGDTEAALTFARLFLETCDRRSDGFDAPSISDELKHTHRIAWDTNLFGRASRLGFQAHKPRHRYDFRNRHGFNRPVDQIFEQLWNGDDLTWSQIVELSDTAVAPIVASRPRLMGDSS